MSDRDKHLDLTRAAWDAYQADYMQFHLKEWPRFHEHFAGGGLMLDDYLVQMLGDVKGLRLLDTCCACDAKQAFSWANLGAAVTACDISPTAIAIAKDNADRIGLDVEFHVADAQTLTPIGSGSEARGPPLNPVPQAIPRTRIRPATTPEPQGPLDTCVVNGRAELVRHCGPRQVRLTRVLRLPAEVGTSRPSALSSHTESTRSPPTPEVAAFQRRHGP